MNKSVKPRIITGLYKQKRLIVPENTRPMTDRVKTSIFDMLNELMAKARVADIFCGSGNLGIESLSRDASFVEFVDQSDDSINALRENLKDISQNKYSVICADFYSYASKSQEKFDIIFLDPPFKYAHKLIESLSLAEKLLYQNGILVLKIPSSIDIPEESVDSPVIFKKKYGINTIYFIQKA